MKSIKNNDRVDAMSRLMSATLRSGDPADFDDLAITRDEQVAQNKFERYVYGRLQETLGEHTRMRFALRDQSGIGEDIIIFRVPGTRNSIQLKVEGFAENRDCKVRSVGFIAHEFTTIGHGGFRSEGAFANNSDKKDPLWANGQIDRVINLEPTEVS